MQNKSALVVDDSRVARMTLIKKLLAHDFIATEFGSGEEALAWLKTTPEQPDIIFMDVMMEGMDGLTATRQIRALPNSKGIPVVICTGNDTPEDKMAAMSAGAEAVLTKPPQVDDVKKILDQVNAKLVATTVATPSPQMAEPPTPEKVEIKSDPVQIDEEALVKKVLQSFREQFLPGLETQLSELSEDVGRSAAVEVAQQVSQKKSEEVVATVPQQVKEQLDEAVEATRATIESRVNEVISASVSLAVEQAAREHMLSDKMMEVVTSQGSDWLKQQEQPLLQEVKQHLQAELPTIISHYLDATLADKVKPLIEEQLETYIEEKTEAQNQQINKLRSQISSANTVAFIAVFVALAAVAAVFLV